MEQKLISAAAVRELCGGVSDMWIWRRLNDPEAGFPEPIYIAKRRFWRASELHDWINRVADESRGAM